MKLYIYIVLVVSLMVSSCKKGGAERGVPPSEKVIEDLNITKTSVKAKFVNKELDLLYFGYLAVKAALVNTDVLKTQDTAKKMAEDLKGLSQYNNVRQIAVLIYKEGDIEKQREFFVGLTDGVFKVINGNVAEGKVFQQMCPMAFNGKGAVWLSDSQEVRNPYFGDVMLACGAVVKIFEN